MHTYMHVCMHTCSKLHTSVHPSMHTYVHACMHTHTPAEARESLLGRPFPHAYLSCLSSRLMDTCGTLCFGACRSRWGLTRVLAQTAEENLSYTDAIQGIIKSDGIQGLLGRGLGTRLVTNGLQVLILIKFVSSNAMLPPPLHVCGGVMRAWLSLGSALVACRNVSLCPSLFLFDLSAGPRTCEACVDAGGNGLGRRECSSRLFGSSLMSTGNDKQWQMEAAASAVGSGV